MNFARTPETRHHTKYQNIALSGIRFSTISEVSLVTSTGIIFISSLMKMRQLI